jgi:hypothetical protein
VLIVLASRAVPAAKTSAPAALAAPGSVVILDGGSTRAPYTTARRLPPGDSGEVNELRNIGAPDLASTLGSTVAWTDVDRIWAEEMERRDPRAACRDGYLDTVCEACGCDAALAERLLDDQLCNAISVADAEPKHVPAPQPPGNSTRSSTCCRERWFGGWRGSAAGVIFGGDAGHAGGPHSGQWSTASLTSQPQRGQRRRQCLISRSRRRSLWLQSRRNHTDVARARSDWRRPSPPKPRAAT